MTWTMSDESRARAQRGALRSGCLLHVALGRGFARLYLALGLVLGLAACDPQVRNHGYVPSEEELQDLVVGIDTRASVEDTVGTPSAAGVLNDAGYFYVAQQVRQFGWREPEVLSREIVAISFDDDGTIQNIERFGLEDGNVIALSRRVTDSNVRGIGFLRQLMGNLGRIAPELLGGGDTTP
ncbi:MAG: outer membrane protein assembly factor BamE [Pseudomonadota bacterium]